MPHRFGPLLGFAFAVGCSSGSFNLPESGDAAVDDGGASGDAADEASSDVAPPSEASVCDPDERPDPTAGVFVSTTGNDASGDGSPLTPLRSVMAGLTKATSRGVARVYLDVGVYAEAVSVGATEAGLIVEGGWRATGAAWSRNCGPTARAQTVIASPANIGLVFDGAAKRSGLRRLTVTTRAKAGVTPDAPGESMFGVWIRGARSVVELEDVAIVAGDAGRGGDARPGDPGVGVSCAGACATGAPGTSGVTGSTPTSQGVFGEAGFTPNDGALGVAGEPGEKGTPGAPGAAGSCATACSGDPGISTGFCGASMTPKMASPGKCGCGGLGGKPGGPGHGGGASVAVLVTSKEGEVRIVDGRLESGKGGAASEGGPGGEGSLGSAGAIGEPLACSSGCYRQPVLPFACVFNMPTNLAGGAAGGVGGKGGQGGNGSDGVGGPSFALVQAEGAVRVVTKDVSFAHGSGGSGARPGAAGDVFP